MKANPFPNFSQLFKNYTLKDFSAYLESNNSHVAVQPQFLYGKIFLP